MSFEMNKIAGAVLAAMIVAMVVGHHRQRAGQAQDAGKERLRDRGRRADGPGRGGARGSGGARADRSAAGLGQRRRRPKTTPRCTTCHTFDKGGPNRVGPNLYGIVGDEIAHGRGGFAFSDALKAKGGTWTVDNLNAWLTNPQAFAKGTKMTFAGFPKAKDRADVIAYLN